MESTAVGIELPFIFDLIHTGRGVRLKPQIQSQKELIYATKVGIWYVASVQICVARENFLLKPLILTSKLRWFSRHFSLQFWDHHFFLGLGLYENRASKMAIGSKLPMFRLIHLIDAESGILSPLSLPMLYCLRLPTIYPLVI